MKKIGCSLLLLAMTLSLAADEGMWMLNNLNTSNRNRMRELGLVLPDSLLYNTDHPSLKDAVVHFNGGCTGVIVSDQGLIFTNHHCGFGAIQALSTPEHNYLNDGFIANSSEEEAPIPNLYVRCLIKTEDVTDQILSQVEGISDEMERAEKIDSICTAIEDSVFNRTQFISGSVSSYFSDNAYYLNIYRTFNDIRLVFAPPASVGKFGGDTDNWMWPRHTCDFSVFRIYANAENAPTMYHADNVPYKPAYFAPVSLQGYEENSYAMTIGYPGYTDRYLSSAGVRQRIHSQNIPRIEVRGVKQDLWKEAMASDERVNLKYSSKYAMSSNYWKNSIGMNRGVERLQVMERKQALEEEFQSWLDANPDQKAVYGEALELIREGYAATDKAQEALTYLTEALLNGSELMHLAVVVMSFDMTTSQERMELWFREHIMPMYKDYNAALDQKVLAAMLKIIGERVSSENLPDIYQEINGKYKHNYEKYAEYLFDKSVIPYPEKLEKMLLNRKNIDKMDKDPAYRFAKSIRAAFTSLRAEIMNYHLDIRKGERLFFAGLRQMMPDRNFSSDANSTMRMSYGHIEGYVPSDGVWYDYSTTTTGILEKYRKDDPEFDIPPKILELLRSNDFGRYEDTKVNLSPTRKHMNVCFLSNNDITGGNSGSPIFNGNGELIGLAFDGNWEAMSGDIVFEPELQRTIGVDIRYILFMIDRWGRCYRLLDELEVR
ncbi:MAG: S46 family peptidase [Dysgonamonadaceae bacterium]|jgi:hypothetical protein|nr:S46 family peptidase [Dysgonamonadaceae bacterium]